MKTRGPIGLLPMHRGIFLFEHQVKTILSVYPHADIIYVSGFEHSKLREAIYGQYPVRLICNENYQETNTAYSISLALDAIYASIVFVIHGDILFNHTAIQCLDNKSSILSAGSACVIDENKPGIKELNGKAVSLAHDLNPRWSQVLRVQDKELTLLRNIVFNYKLSQRWFTYEVINKIISRKGSVAVCENQNAKVIEINNLKKINQAVIMSKELK